MTTPSETTPDNIPVQENAPDQNSVPNVAAPIELKYNPHEGVEEPYRSCPAARRVPQWSRTLPPTFLAPWR